MVGSSPGQVNPKTYLIGISCLSANHAALRSKSKEWLARYQSNVSEWNDMSSLGLLVQYFIVALSKANYECWSNTKQKLLISHQNGRHNRA